MNIRNTFAIVITAMILLGATGCAVTRGQETVGTAIDDTTITTQVKGRFVENTSVEAASILVETLNGVVTLSGLAKSVTERNTAKANAHGDNGVRSVRNESAVRP